MVLDAAELMLLGCLPSYPLVLLFSDLILKIIQCVDLVFFLPLWSVTVRSVITRNFFIVLLIMLLNFILLWHRTVKAEAQRY